MFHVHCPTELLPPPGPPTGSSCFKGSPAPIALPSCSQTPAPLGWAGTRCLQSCQTAGTDEAAPDCGSEDAGWAPPQPNTTPWLWGGAEMLRSAGDQRGHGRAANPPTSLGPPQLTPTLRVSLGGERSPQMANKAPGERCETSPLASPPHEVVPRGLAGGSELGEPITQGLVLASLSRD